MTQGEFFAYVVDILEALGIPYMITGSVASMAYGEPRMTLDMDVVIDLTEKKAKAFCSKFDNDFYKDLDSILEAIHQAGHFNIIHIPSGSKVDFFILKDDPLSQEMFCSKHKESFDEKRGAFFSSPENVIINKLIYYKEGRSEKHLKDIQGMLQVSGDQLNLKYIDEKTKELDLYQYWKDLRESS